MEKYFEDSLINGASIMWFFSYLSEPLSFSDVDIADSLVYLSTKNIKQTFLTTVKMRFYLSWIIIALALEKHDLAAEIKMFLQEVYHFGPEVKDLIKYITKRCELSIIKGYKEYLGEV